MSNECGADCADICSIIYELLCGHCKFENRCHENDIDHGYMVDCAMKYVRRSDEFMKNKFERK